MLAKRLVLMLAAFALLIFAAGCGGSDKKSSSEEPTGGTLKVGVAGPFTGVRAKLGEDMKMGVELAADEINDDGGLFGKKIEVVAIDDAADPKVGVKATKAAIADGLDAVIGPYQSGVGVVTLPMFIKHGLTPIRLTSDNATDGMGYTLQPMVDQIAPVTSEAITKWLKAKKVAIVFDPSQIYTRSVAKEVKTDLEKSGVKIAAFEPIKPRQADYSKLVKHLSADDGADVIYAAAYAPEGGAIAKAMHEQKIKAECLIDYASYVPVFRMFAGVAAEHCSVVGVPEADDFEGGTEHVEAFEEKFNTHPGNWSPFTYDSLKFLADGAEKAGSLDADKLKPVLSAVKDWQGWTGSVTIDPKTGNRDNAPVVVTSVDKDGHFHVNKEWATAVGATF